MLAAIWLSPSASRLRRALLLAPALFAGFQAIASAAAQDRPPGDAGNPFGRKYPPRVYRTVRLQGAAPVIDGRLDDGAWSQGEWAGDYTQQMPVDGAKPSQPTELKILYDDKHIYFAIRAYDDPGKVHAYPG